MTDLSEQVTAALEHSILPSVIARGATLRVTGMRDGVVTLEVTGSPGAVQPLTSRIGAQIRAAVPGVTGVRIVTPVTGPPPAGGPQPAPPPDDRSLAGQARRILDTEVNPAIAAHHGHVSLIGVDQGLARIRLEGGCQGCSLAEVTIRQGIEPLKALAAARERLRVVID